MPNVAAHAASILMGDTPEIRQAYSRSARQLVEGLMITYRAN